MIFQYLKEYMPEVRHEIDLRESIGLLRPKPDFELFIGLLLKEYDYEIKMNQIIAGKCVEHEIDTVATKDGKTTLVEIKHHYQYHTYTGVGVFLEVQAAFEDLVEGYKTGKNKINFSNALVVCNTKISDHALRYATCIGIYNIGWRSPANLSLEQMIEDKKLYPITFLKGLTTDEEARLGDLGIVMLKQLAEIGIGELNRETKIPKERLKSLVRNAIEILG